MQLVCIDFESFFSTKEGYSLKRMTTEAYLRSPLFKAHGCAIRWPSGTTEWWTGAHLRHLFDSIDWSNTALCMHHGQFDAGILSFIYGKHPALILCTLAMANQLLPHEPKSLGLLAKRFGLPDKDVPYRLFDGIRDLPIDVERQVAQGAVQDVNLNYALLQKFLAGDPAHDLPAFPKADILPMSITIQMFTKPSLCIDIPRADALAERIHKQKADKLRALVGTAIAAGDVTGFTDDQVVEAVRASLASREAFAETLRFFDVEPPLKEKKGKTARPGEMTYAFGKKDLEKLIESVQERPELDAETITAVIEAKIGVASTINETRAKRIADTARRGQPVPVYLKWASTFSQRTGGGDKLNWGNLERLPNKDKTTGEYEKDKYGYIRKGEIRLCVVSTPGYTIVVGDLSQIECRELATAAGQNDLVEQFRRKEDVYSRFIEPYYGYPVSKDTPSERGTGKQLLLSAQYLAGDRTIQATAALGTYGPPLHISLEEAGRLKQYYRTRNHMIRGYWDQADFALETLVGGGSWQWGHLRVQDRRIWLPNGAALDYTTLRRYTPGPEEPEWTHRTPQYAMKTRNGIERIHKGVVTAHVTSSSCRLIMTEALVPIAARYRAALTVYDEIVCVVRDEEADDCMAWMKECMERRVWWLPQLPVEAEIHKTKIYDK